MSASSQRSVSADTRAVPTGTVVFLFSDIEGSTHRWERHHEAMETALMRHDAMVRAAIETQCGYIFKTVGDAFCAAFRNADEAIAAAARAQTALQAEDFSEVEGLRVRMALHAGVSTERDGDYFGPTVNRVARLLAIAHGGQVLLSGFTADLSEGKLPPDSSLRDLGFAQLKDLAAPERVWQLDVAGLLDEFPPLRSIDALPNNLPAQRTTFVGREQDVSDVKGLLERHRLLTLVGSGGVGKTRLAVQIGADVLDRYPNGVWFVDFAPIGDPELASSVVAQALGISQQQDRSVGESIPLWLKRKKLLLIFDNCEHVLESVAALADAILAAAEDVRILATSRQVLNVDGEATHRLSSLAWPDDVGLTAEGAMHYGAVALFVDRARAADTRFTFTDDIAPIIAEICHRLDGIALAIELAAARVKVLSIPNLARRLNERFTLLTGGSRSALPRQKTLTAAIDWSYDLLSSQEQLLFTRLGVFAGGFGLDAVTAVCAGGSLDEDAIFDLLASLADKSLIVIDTSGLRERYRLLESTTAYALEKLDALGERGRLARRHAQYFRGEATSADQGFGKPSPSAWLAGVELELDNYRTALEWALTHDNDAALGGEMAGTLSGYWRNAGLEVEGRYWIELALARVSESEQPAIAARLLLTLSGLSFGRVKGETAERALRLYEIIGDSRGAGQALLRRGLALYHMGQLDDARDATAKALVALRACGDERKATDCLCTLANIEAERGDRAAARELHAQALAGMKSFGSDVGAAAISGNMAESEFAAGDAAEALRLADEALELTSKVKDPNRTAWQANRGAYQIALGDVEAARESVCEALRLARQADDELNLGIAIQHFALLEALNGASCRAAWSLGFVDAQHESLGIKREYTEQWGYSKLRAALREALDDHEIERLAVEGATWSSGRAIEEVLKA